jgi:hypothetical protein
MNGEGSVLKAGAVACALAGILAIVYWGLHPLPAATAATPHDAAYWAVVAGARYALANVVFVVLMLASLTGFVLVGIALPSVGAVWRIAALVVALCGHALLVSGGIFYGFVAPVLASDRASWSLLELRGPLLGGPLHGVFGVGGLLFAAAFVMLSVLVGRRRVLPLPVAALLALGAVAVAIHPMLGLNARLFGFVVFGKDYQWLADACWREAGRSP